jgi:hypothetical protein
MEAPGDRPATKDPYLLIYWEQGVHSLVELLHQKDREMEEWIKIHDRAIEFGEHWQEEYWKLRKEIGLKEKK